MKTYKGMAYKHLTRGLWVIYKDKGVSLESIGYVSSEAGVKLWISVFNNYEATQ
jgi:hypothetical protein